MPSRKPPSKLPYRKMSGRSRAWPHTSRSGSSRHTPGPVRSLPSSGRSVSTANSTSGRPGAQIREGPFLQSALIETPSEVEREDDTLTEIIMAVDFLPRGTVGCCYYVARDEKLFLMEDIQHGNVDIIDTRE